MDDPAALLARALADPEAALRVLNKADAEESLLDFTRLTWPVLEPGREFREGWALEAICDHLEAVEAGQIKRLLIMVPPGHMKSLATGVFFPAWVWGPRARPDRRFISWSYSEGLTLRDNRKLRKLVTSDIYRSFWGDRFGLTGDQNEKRLFENSQSGFSFASGVRGGGTGHRGDFLRIDDPHKVLEAESDVRREEVLQWWSETLSTRTSDDEASFIVVMQRVHERDLAGFLLESELDFEVLCLPCRYEADHPTPSRTSLGFRDPRAQDGTLLWPEFFSEERIDEGERSLAAWGGRHAIDAQLQQRPTARGGGMFREEHAQYLDALAPGTSVRGWDLAASTRAGAAYTAGVRLTRAHDGRILVDDVTRLRGSAHEVKEAVRRTAEQDGRGVRISIPQDPGQSGKAQAQDFVRDLQGFDVRTSPESGDKAVRANPFSAQWEGGNVWMVRAPWNGQYLRELVAFGKGARFKDQVDATSRAYAELLKMQPSTGISMHGPRVVTG